MMSLPGGINVSGELRRDFHFRPITGELELRLGESSQHAACHAARVTAVLCEALESIGGAPASSDAVRGLSVGDRQFLMTRLAAHIDHRPVWVTAHCGACGQPFDLSYRYSDLPAKRAGGDYPRTMVETSRGRVAVRVPTGADQERIAAAGSDEDAMAVLLRCVLEEGVDPDGLSEADVAAIERAVEAMAPEMATALSAVCPECGADNRVALNPYACLERPVDELFAEIHTIASQYHWSEQAILALPRGRRQRYLRLIDQGRGMQGPEDSAPAGWG